MTRLVEARHLRDYVVWLRFEDGTTGEIDLSDRLYGAVFEPLKAPGFFQSFRVDQELQTLVWPNGADFAPESSTKGYGCLCSAVGLNLNAGTLVVRPGSRQQVSSSCTSPIKPIVRR